MAATHQLHPDERCRTTKDLETPEVQLLGLVVLFLVQGDTCNPKCERREEQAVGEEIDGGPEVLATPVSMFGGEHHPETSSQWFAGAWAQFG